MSHILQVGKPYSENKKHWPEGVDYNFRSGQHELRIFMRSPYPGEVKAIKEGRAHFALAVKGDVIYFMYKFGALPWGDCGFTIHLVPEDERIIPEAPQPNEHAVLTTILTDAENSIVRAMRLLTFSLEFTQRFHAEIAAQAARPPITREQIEAQAMEVYRVYPTSEHLTHAAVVSCRGGE